jgi:hypothetical protein
MMITAFTGYMLLYTFVAVRSTLSFKYSNVSLGSYLFLPETWETSTVFLYTVRAGIPSLPPPRPLY